MYAGIGCGEVATCEKIFKATARQTERLAALVGVGRLVSVIKAAGVFYLRPVECLEVPCFVDVLSTSCRCFVDTLSILWRCVVDAFSMLC